MVAFQFITTQGELTMLDKTRAEIIKELQAKLKPMQPQPIFLSASFLFLRDWDNALLKERKLNNVR